MYALIFPTPPANMESQKNEGHFNETLASSNYSSHSVILVEHYVRQVTDLQSQLKRKKITRLEKLKKLGLIGALDDTGVTSTNYKESFYLDKDNNQ
jgi:hypothetical protein